MNCDRTLQLRSNTPNAIALISFSSKDNQIGAISESKVNYFLGVKLVKIQPNKNGKFFKAAKIHIFLLKIQLI